MTDTVAFNKGSDARIAGEPLESAPVGVAWASSWRMGWLDCNRNWGLSCVPGTYPPLPPVREPVTVEE